MALKQPNSATVYPEPKGGVVGPAVLPVTLQADSYGGYTVTPNGAIDARMLADAYGGFTVHAGGDNPSALAELRMAEIAGVVSTYQ